MNENLAIHNDQRVGVFIDTQNLYHSAKANYRTNVNYEELLEVAVSGRKLIRAFAYVIRSEENTEEKFFDALEDLGIECRVKDLQIFHTGAKKADWDVGIAVDMIRMTEKVDIVVLASGDGDFLEVVRYCQSRGVRVELMAFEKNTNTKIKEEVDHFIDLGDPDADFLIGRKRRTTSIHYQPKTSVLVASNTNQTSQDLEKGSDYLVAQRSATNYENNNLSTVNRLTGNNEKKVDPKIFGSKNVRKVYVGKKPLTRKIKPVVGLPGKPSSQVLPKKVLINDETKQKKSIQNAFGNQEPPHRGFFR